MTIKELLLDVYKEELDKAAYEWYNDGLMGICKDKKNPVGLDTLFTENDDND